MASGTHRLEVLAHQVAPTEEGRLTRSLTRAHVTPPGFTSQFPQASNAGDFPDYACDALNLDALLTPEEREIRLRTRAYMTREVAPIIADYWERAEFPHGLVPNLAKLQLGGGTISGYGCPGLSIMQNCMAVLEMARVDASVATFMLVHNFLALETIGLLGSEEQKRELLPGLARLDLIGCWALTEPSNGSDAAALQCTATKVQGGWELNGQKRWIGNGTFADVVVVWARSSVDKQVNCFIVRKGTPGFTPTKIENKIALRCVQNADMVFDRCFVPDSARLTGVGGFKDTNKVLAVSRIMVSILPVGMAMGAYDMAVRYLKQREQFGTPLASFQLVQERLGRMLGNIQAMFMLSWQLCREADSGRVSHEQASLVKGWNTLRGRETVSLARELLGGNGILSDFHVAKAFCDMEAIYTYEGTYDVNMLVTGRGITGVSAIKAPGPQARRSTPHVQA